MTAATQPRADTRWIARCAPTFPERLRSLAPPIAGLWQRGTGELSLWQRPSIAIIGMRAASAAGREIARTLAWELVRCGALVVSGLARGIDAAAHEGALAGGGSTVAVLGCGLDPGYPP